LKERIHTHTTEHKTIIIEKITYKKEKKEREERKKEHDEQMQKLE